MILGFLFAQPHAVVLPLCAPQVVIEVPEMDEFNLCGYFACLRATYGPDEVAWRRKVELRRDRIAVIRRTVSRYWEACVWPCTPLQFESDEEPLDFHLD